MELWIRNQNKEQLAKIEYIEYFCKKLHYANEEKPREEHHNIGTYINDEQYMILGEYKTKERALEVLDEIQNILMPRFFYKADIPIEIMKDSIYQIKQNVDINIRELSSFVYEMPEE